MTTAPPDDDAVLDLRCAPPDAIAVIDADGAAWSFGQLAVERARRTDGIDAGDADAGDADAGDADAGDADTGDAGAGDAGAGDADAGDADAGDADAGDADADDGETGRGGGIGGAGRAEAIVAEPGIATLRAIYRALAERRPLGLINHRLPAEERARQAAAVRAAELPAGTAFVLFTSGSTGAARGVVIPRAAVVANARASEARFGWRADDRWLLELSCAHTGGLSVVTRCLIARRPVQLGWAPGGVTLASLVPTQLAALLDDPAWPPAALRAVLLGGAAAPPALLDAARARGVPVRTSYGLTETFGQVATALDDRSAPVPLPGVELLAGTDEQPARIRVRGPTLATGYLDGAPIAPELATADLGALDASTGELRVLGRADDVIITGGENVHPLAVEAAVAATPGVRAVVAFGVPDERWGQLVAIALEVDAAFDLDAAAARWRHALPGHALPRRVAIAAALPQGATGKLDRRAAAALPARPVRYAR